MDCQLGDNTCPGHGRPGEHDGSWPTCFPASRRGAAGCAPRLPANCPAVAGLPPGATARPRPPLAVAARELIAAYVSVLTPAPTSSHRVMPVPGRTCCGPWVRDRYRVPPRSPPGAWLGEGRLPDQRDRLQAGRAAWPADGARRRHGRLAAGPGIRRPADDRSEPKLRRGRYSR